MWIKSLFGFCLVALVVSLSASTLHSQGTLGDWRADFEVEDGFSVSIDTLGYTLPSAIAFVPNPGSAPDDPLYFVTELEGKLKVVTNDRTVRTFADVQLRLPDAPLRGEAGMAGICLAPEHGYVFVTFTNQDADGFLKNNILRFDTRPGTFSIAPTGQLRISEVFAEHRTVGSHQIGGCQVQEDYLYVSVGDGALIPGFAQNLNSPLGKVLKMGLDGRPAEDNPLYEDDSLKRASNYIWAYGMKNPWGIKATNGRIFVADNGNRLDRFMEVRKGENYLWDATDQSIAAKADVVIYPSGGVVQMDLYPEGLSIFPDQFRDRFYLTISRGASAGILTIQYDFDKNQTASVPRYFLRLGRTQLIAGLAFGPDGLYIVPIRPIIDGAAGVLKITYDPTGSYPYTMVHANGNELMYQKGCTGCHVIPSAFYGEEFTGRPEIGPSLDRDALVARLMERLNSREYAASVQELDQLETEPYVSFRQARREVLEAEGMDRIRAWLEYRVQEPRFDNRTALMPNLGISKREAILIADALIEGASDDQGFLDQVASTLLPKPGELRRLHIVQYFAIGFAIGGIVIATIILVFQKFYRLIRSDW